MSITEKYQVLLDKIRTEYIRILGCNLVGIYVHGSIAFKCFNWDKSDIDFLVVIHQNIDIEVKLKLLAVLNAIRVDAPEKGFEMSVIKKEYCENFIFPTPFELHFSSMWLEKYLQNPYAFCETMNGTDEDLAAHFTVIKHAGIVLCGTAINEVFGEVKKEYYISSIKYDIENAKAEIVKNPIYIILNLCRVLAFLKDGLVVSKKEGGEWGLINLPDKYYSIVEKALHCYCCNEIMELDNGEGIDFCEYMLNNTNNIRSYHKE